MTVLSQFGGFESAKTQFSRETRGVARASVQPPPMCAAGPAGARLRAVTPDDDMKAWLFGASEWWTGSWGGFTRFVETVDGKCVTIAEGFAVINGEDGYKHFARLHVRPENIAGMLPEPEEHPSEVLAVLCIVGGFKSFARADIMREYKLGAYSVDNPLIQECIKRGLLKANKAGSIRITTEGKNARPRRAPEDIRARVKYGSL